MFLDFFGLKEQPFGVTPDPRFLYMSPAHAEAFASLVYAIETGRGFAALIAAIISVLVGFLLGPRALGGMLLGAIVTGLFLALQMTSGGAAWDNAKKIVAQRAAAAQQANR